MKHTSNKSGNNHAASAKSLERSSDHRQQRITLSMIEADLEDLMTDFQSLYAKIITKGYGVLTKARWLFTGNR